MPDDFTYVAHAFHPSLGNQMATGQLVLGAWTLRFESEESSLEWPLDEVQIQLGGQGDERIFFLHAEYPDWSITTADHQILDHRIFKQKSHLRNQLKEIRQRREGMRRLIVTLVALGCLALLLLLISLFSGWAVRALVAQVPASFEKTLGDSLFEEMAAEIKIIQEPKLVAELNVLTAHLNRGLPKKDYVFQFHIIEEATENACALPGGHVLVTSGLLKLADKPEEIAGVLAHEIAHVTERHGFRQILSGAGPYLVVKVLFGDSGGLLSLIGNSSQVLVQQSFSRDYEREADDCAWKYLVAANIDPRGFIDCLKKFKVQEEKEKAGVHLEVRALNTHPPTEERIQRLEAKWKKLKRKSGFIEFEKER